MVSVDDNFDDSVQFDLICACHRHQDFWVSVYGGHLTCGSCHPPVDESIVSEWINSGTRKPGVLESMSISRAS